MVLLFWTALAGCQRDPVSQTQRDCAQATVAWSVTQVHAEVYPLLSQDCIDSLAARVGSMSLALRPLVMRVPTCSPAALYGLSPESAAGLGWFAFVALATERVEVVSDAEMDGAQMRYRASENTLFVTDSLGWWTEAIGEGFPFQVSGLLVHEAAHASAPPHIDCTRGDDAASCDADVEGAYGAQLWLEQEWMLSSPELLAHRDCEQLEGFGRGLASASMSRRTGRFVQERSSASS